MVLETVWRVPCWNAWTFSWFKGLDAPVELVVYRRTQAAEYMLLIYIYLEQSSKCSPHGELQTVIAHHWLIERVTSEVTLQNVTSVDQRQMPFSTLHL